MTLTLIDLYNDITGQAWSMFDGDVEAQDEFEKSVTSSIQKALNELWCSYKFPFRNKTMSFRTRSGVLTYSAPIGNIATEMVKGKRVYCVRIGKKYLEYEPDYKTLEEKEGEPDRFYYQNDKLYLYPSPDATYKVDVAPSSSQPEYTLTPIFFTIAMAVVSCFSWEGVHSLLITMGLVINTFCMGVFDAKDFRKTILISSALILEYNIFALSYSGMLSETISLVSVVIGIIRYSGSKAQSVSPAKKLAA